MNPINYDILNDAKDSFREIHGLVSSFRTETDENDFVKAPIFYPEFRDTSRKILYVGINPSLTENMLSKFESVHGELCLLSLEYLEGLKGGELEGAISRLIDFQAALKGRNDRLQGVGRISYFSKIEDLHKEAFCGCGIGWEHFDLFSYRFTHQPFIVKTFQVKRRKNSERIGRFFESSIKRFATLVESGGFMGVVVLNAAASKFIQNKRILGLDGFSEEAQGKIIFFRQLGGRNGINPHQKADLIETMRFRFSNG
jgi:hypothetical protein